MGEMFSQLFVPKGKPVDFYSFCKFYPKVESCGHVGNSTVILNVIETC